MLPQAAPSVVRRFFPPPWLSVPLICILFAIAGCSSTMPREKRPKLSEAGEEGSKPEEEQRAIEAPSDWLEEATEEDENDAVVAAGILGGLATPPAQGVSPNRYGDEPSGADLGGNDRFRFGVVAGAGNISARAMDTYTQAGLLVGVHGDRFTADLRGYIGSPDLDESHDVAAVSGFKNVYTLCADGVVRGYLMPGHTAMAIGGLVGARWGRVEWDYRHPILVEESDGETFEVDSDAVQYFAPFIGATGTPFRMGNFSFDVDLDGGYQFFGGTTDLAFENDLYKDSGFLEILWHVVYRQVE